MSRTSLLRTPGLLALALFISLSSVACGRPFKVQTAPGFLELEGQKDDGYDYRATTPEGVVVAVRVIDDEDRADNDFWTRTLTLKLRDEMGYALVGQADAVSADGTKGKTLKFAHDENGKPYDYWVTVFLAQGRLFLVESGAPRELMDKARPSVEWMTKSVKVKCDTFVSPVFASRTCNRW
jgi:hypothetical protein